MTQYAVGTRVAFVNAQSCTVHGTVEANNSSRYGNEILVRVDGGNLTWVSTDSLGLAPLDASKSDEQSR